MAEVLIDFVVNSQQLNSAIELLEKTGQVDAKVGEQFRKTNAELNKQASAAKNVANDLKGPSKQLDELNKKTKSFGSEFEKAIQLGVMDALKEAGVSIEDVKKRLGELADKPVKATTTLKQELRALNEEIAAAVSRGENFGENFDTLVQKAGNLRDSIDEANAVIKDAASDTKGFDNLLGLTQTLAGGFAVLQGAAGLFGDESEEIQKTLLKVNSAMAILQGLQQVQAALQRDGAITLALLNAQQKINVIQTNLQTAAESKNIVVRKLATAAQWALNAAMAANPIGILITLLAAVATALVIYTRNSRAAAEATGELRGAVRNLTDELSKSEESINRLAEREIIDLERVGAKQSEITGVRIASLRNLILANDEAYRRNKEIFDKGLGDEEERAALEVELENTRKRNINLRIDLQKLQLEQERQISAEQKELADAQREREAKLAEAQKQRIADSIARLKTEQLAVDEGSSAYIRLERAIIRLQALYDSLGQSADQATFTIAKGAKDVANTTQDLIKASIEEVQKEFGKAAPELVKDVTDITMEIQELGRVTSEVITDTFEKSFQEVWEDFLNNTIPKIQQGLGALNEISQGLNVIAQERINNQQILIENQRTEVDELLAAGAITEKEAESRQKRIDRQESIQRTKAAQQAKQLAIFQAIISTAQAVVNALATPPAPVGIALAAVVGAIGAAQIAAISARPLPRFASGKKGTYEGFGVMGEAGAELMVKDGRMFVATKPTMVHIGRKDKIFTASETRKILPNVDKGAMMPVPVPGFDYSKIAKMIPGQSGVNINIDREFITEAVDRGLMKNNYFNRRYSSK